MESLHKGSLGPEDVVEEIVASGNLVMHGQGSDDDLYYYACRPDEMVVGRVGPWV